MELLQLVCSTVRATTVVVAKPTQPHLHGSSPRIFPGGVSRAPAVYVGWHVHTQAA
jgi:hypothetical protein